MNTAAEKNQFEQPHPEPPAGWKEKIEVEVYKQALEKIAYPINYLRKEAEKEGAVLNGVAAIALSKDGTWLSDVAVKALEQAAQANLPSTYSYQQWGKDVAELQFVAEENKLLKYFIRLCELGDKVNQRKNALVVKQNFAAALFAREREKKIMKRFDEVRSGILPLLKSNTQASPITATCPYQQGEKLHRFVKASEPPKEPGWYHATLEDYDKNRYGAFIAYSEKTGKWDLANYDADVYVAEWLKETAPLTAAAAFLTQQTEAIGKKLNIDTMPEKEYNTLHHLHRDLQTGLKALERLGEIENNNQNNNHEY